MQAMCSARCIFFLKCDIDVNVDYSLLTGFFTNTKLKILTSEASYVKTKKISNEMLPPVRIEPGTSAI